VIVTQDITPPTADAGDDKGICSNATAGVGIWGSPTASVIPGT